MHISGELIQRFADAIENCQATDDASLALLFEGHLEGTPLGDLKLGDLRDLLTPFTIWSK